MDQTIVEYFSNRQCSPQWKGFLAAMADEFSTQLPDADLRSLMRRIGVRFAEQTPLAACQTIGDLQFAMNEIWAGQDWGWAALEEKADHLYIHHHCAPLQAAFGANGSSWTPAFLEGAYQRWFQELGSGELGVKQASDINALGSVEFRLGR